jgi:tRNA pseudouridine32 synthase/23S rRNA pseudouridine746 synthase
MVATIYRLSDFLDRVVLPPIEVPPTYEYQGYCPYTNRLLKLPRTVLVEAIALGLMQQLKKEQIYQAEGKMYGVLLVQTPTGEHGVLKAFSGLLQGAATVEGWVEPIPGRDRVVQIETETLRALETIKQELIDLANLPERTEYHRLSTAFDQQREELNRRHRDRKLARDRQRAEYDLTLTGVDLDIALAQLQHQSQLDGIERRHLKRDRDLQLLPLQDRIDRAEERMRLLKQQRKNLSRQLQQQMHAAHNLMNFLGTSTSLRDLIPGGIPTGTGDCCAPKLLHYAATHQLKPLAMAEFWWGSSQGDKIQGEFYPACRERCQPLMGFLLSGITDSCTGGSTDIISTFNEGLRTKPVPTTSHSQLPILYQDEWIIAIDKPSGLLSVPGRYLDRQDSVLTRLRRLYPQDELFAVHRLDRDTSGILLLSRDRDSYRYLSQQFEQRRVHKVYTAVVGGLISPDRGEIALPLSADPDDRPRQRVDWENGKPTLTKFRILDRIGNFTHIEFIPLTGRTHQLRIHAADLQGLGIPILGDRLYGCLHPVDRLHLHAQALLFHHPRSGELIYLQVSASFRGGYLGK